MKSIEFMKKFLESISSNMTIINKKQWLYGIIYQFFMNNLNSYNNLLLKIRVKNLLLDQFRKVLARLMLACSLKNVFTVKIIQELNRLF